MTVAEMVEEISTAITAGMKRYLGRPFDPEEMQQEARRAVRATMDAVEVIHGETVWQHLEVQTDLRVGGPVIWLAALTPHGVRLLNEMRGSPPDIRVCVPAPQEFIRITVETTP
jgi:DNA-binding response OmpR family regulator